MPVALAFVAGGLSTLNPCGFSLLPAMLSLYISGEQSQQSGFSLDAVRAGGRVAAGFVVVFAAVGIPIVFGLGRIAAAIPWAGAVTGVIITFAGIAALMGRHVGIAVRYTPTPLGGRPSLFLFGVAYAIASLGCTLPVFLSVVGASLAARGPVAASVVLASFAGGMTLMMMAIAIGASSVRGALIRALKGSLRHVPRLSGVLLVAAGTYLTYYWSRILFGPIATLADDPIVGTVQRFTAGVESFATRNAPMLMVLAVALVLAVAGAAVVKTTARSKPDPPR